MPSDQLKESSIVLFLSTRDSTAITCWHIVLYSQKRRSALLLGTPEIDERAKLSIVEQGQVSYSIFDRNDQFDLKYACRKSYNAGTTTSRGENDHGCSDYAWVHSKHGAVEHNASETWS